MPFSADAVANEFLDIAQSAEAEISPMKMQKLVYFSHGWNLALSDDPLIKEQVQAWKYGPVIQPLYREFKRFGDGAITEKAFDARFINNKLEVWQPILSEESSNVGLAKAIINKIWQLYRNYTAIQLSTLTHQEGTPWRRVVDAFPKGTFLSGVTIPNELIRDYFKSQMRAG